MDQKDVPMVYPYREKCKRNSEYINCQKIYCATYWPNVLEWSDYSVNSYHLTSEIIALPIDQRYNQSDMIKIIEIINN